MREQRQKTWTLASIPDTVQVQSLSRALEVSPLVARILLRRGFASAAEAERFLDPRLTELHDPFRLKGMSAAVERLFRALTEQESTLVLGDYDADGVSACALLVHFLRACGHTALEWLIPQRARDGYGLTETIVEQLCARKPQLLITVDNGITAVDAVRTLHAAGIDTLITDHHLPSAMEIPAGVVVNPQQAQCGYPEQTLSGCGVAFKLITALRCHLRKVGFWNPGRLEPNLRDYLDLVAIGTVADQVSLRGENRILVKHGLEVLRKHPRPGLAALLRCLPRRSKINSELIAFQLAPRINAPGRLGDASLAVELLLSENSAEAAAIAAQLDRLNQERRQWSTLMEEEALHALRAQNGGAGAPAQGEDAAAIVVHSERFHPGLIGQVAGRLAERFGCPALALAPTALGYRGSARGSRGINVTAAIAAGARHLVEYGGHAAAAGCTVRAGELDAFSDAFREACAQSPSSDPPVELEERLELEEINSSLVDQLQQLAPFGTDHSEPLFLIDPAEELNPRGEVFAGRHLKWRLGPRKELIAWGMAEELDPQASCVYGVRLGFNDYTEGIRLTAEAIFPK